MEGDWQKVKQQTLAMASGFERYGKKTRRAMFLEEMGRRSRGRNGVRGSSPCMRRRATGRPPVGADAADLFLQQWFNLSDPGVEEVLYDSAGMRQFVGIDLGREPVPDETTVCKFRHLLEQHEFVKPMRRAIKRLRMLCNVRPPKWFLFRMSPRSSMRHNWPA